MVTVCDKSFTVKGSLASHINYAHRQKDPYNCNFCDKKGFFENTTFYVIFVHCDSSISRTHITRPDYKERAKGYKSFDSSHDFRTQGARRAKRFLGVTVCSIIMGFSLTLLTRILLNGISHARMTLKGAKIDALLQP